MNEDYIPIVNQSEIEDKYGFGLERRILSSGLIFAIIAPSIAVILFLIGLILK
jgi:hypothetical protein